MSRIVERYLALLARLGPGADEATPPVLARLRGVLKGADRRSHRRHLERKYR